MTLQQDRRFPGRGRKAPRGRRAGERGVLLVALLVAITVMMILLAASAQSWTAIMKREREEELIFRGNQYMHALRAYHKDHGGTFPTELKALLDSGPGGLRYIRQLYPDPFGQDGEWNLLYLGPDGKSALNPHARNPVPGLPGGQGAVRGLPGSGSGLGGLSDRGDAAATSRSRLRDRRRKSRFKSGNVNTPIVGVVSQGFDKAFQQYFERDYYDEWEFHVFLLDIPTTQRKGGAVPGQNINPSGQTGRGHGIRLRDPKDPNSAMDPASRARRKGQQRP